MLIKDLLRRKAKPAGIVIWLCLPLLLAFLMGMISSGGSSSDQPNIEIPLLVEDHDDSFVSQFLIGAFSRGELGKMFSITPVDSAQGKPLMDKGKASALLIIPRGLGDSLFTSGSSTLILVKNPAQSFLPKIVQETVLILAEAGDRGLRLLDSPVEKISTLNDSPTEVDVADIAVQIHRIVTQVEPLLLPPIIEISEETIREQKDEPASSFSLFGYLVSGVAILIMMFMLDNLAKDIFVEKEQKTLFRILTTPATRSQVFASKLLFMWIMALIALLLVWLFAILIFHVSVASLTLFAALLIVSSGALSALAGLLYSFIETRAQASGIVPALIMVFAILGGAMLPLESLPGFLRQFAPVSPLYWVVYPWQRLMGFGDLHFKVFLYLGVLAAFTLAGNALTFWIMDKKVRI